MENGKKGRSPGRPKLNEIDQPTSEKIIAVAIKMFLEFGFQKVSVDEIASEAGMTKATVYYYFGSKSELFKEALVKLMQRVKTRIEHLLSKEDSLYNRLFEVTKGHLIATTTIDLEGFIRESKVTLSESQVEAMKQAEEDLYQAIEKSFSEAMAEGEIPKVDARFAAHAYVSLVKVGNYRDKEDQSLFESVDEASEKILSLLWNGLFKPAK